MKVKTNNAVGVADALAASAYPQLNADGTLSLSQKKPCNREKKSQPRPDPTPLPPFPNPPVIACNLCNPELKATYWMLIDTGENLGPFEWFSDCNWRYDVEGTIYGGLFYAAGIWQGYVAAPSEELIENLRGSTQPCSLTGEYTNAAGQRVTVHD